MDHDHSGIRPAIPDDVETLRDIVREAYGGYVERIGREPGPMGADYAALVSGGTVWVAERGGVIAGLLVLLPEPEALLLDNVAVGAPFRGRGIGRALIEFAEAEARRRHYQNIRLYTHEKMVENLALYRALGWTETGRAEQNGFDRVFFTKAL